MKQYIFNSENEIKKLKIELMNPQNNQYQVIQGKNLLK